MTRIKFVFTVWLLSVLWATSVAGQGELAGEELEARPNILLILADDLGHGDLGCYGQKTLRTPNIDSLATEGLRFTQAYAGNTVCCPSRSSLMTGHHPGHAIHRGNYGITRPDARHDLSEWARVAFPAGTQTVGSVLQEAGYHTAHIGKWHLGGTIQDRNFPNFLGFAHSYAYHLPNFEWTRKVKRSMTGSFNYTDLHRRNLREVPILENAGGRRGLFADDAHTAEALRFIQQQEVAEKPFFLYLAYRAVHAPLDPPMDVYPYEGEDQDWPDGEKRFAAYVARLDAYVGQILDALEKTGQSENTLVIFSSDNGAFDSKDHSAEFFDSNGELRGYKADMYEGGIRVPLLARWPGKVAAGRESDHLVAFWDFLPTLAEVGGSEVRGSIDGLSFYPTLVGDASRQREHPYLYWEFLEWDFAQAVRLQDWKAVRSNGAQPIELYDLASDPSETTNVAEAHPEIVAVMRHILRTARVESPYWPVEVIEEIAAGRR